MYCVYVTMNNSILWLPQGFFFLCCEEMLYNRPYADKSSALQSAIGQQIFGQSSSGDGVSEEKRFHLKPPRLQLTKLIEQDHDS